MSCVEAYSSFELGHYGEHCGFTQEGFDDSEYQHTFPLKFLQKPLLDSRCQLVHSALAFPHSDSFSLPTNDDTAPHHLCEQVYLADPYCLAVNVMQFYCAQLVGQCMCVS